MASAPTGSYIKQINDIPLKDEEARNSIDGLRTNLGTLQTNFNKHTTNKNNPHGVTADQVSLGPTNTPYENVLEAVEGIDSELGELRRLPSDVQKALQTANNASSTATSASNTAANANARAQEAIEVAYGRARAAVFDTFNAMKTALANDDGTSYKIGDNLLIKATNVPDYWISEVQSSKSGDYGYYKISELETQKVNIDLSAYQTKELAAAIEIDNVPYVKVENTLIAIASKLPSFVTTSSVVNNLTSTSTTAPLAAAQGKALDGKITGISNRVGTLEGYFDNNGTVFNATQSQKTYTFADSEGGAINMGSSIKPIYFSNGVPVACTYKLEKDVPSNALFTDTNTWRPVVNNLTSDSTDSSLSAAQGKALDGKITSLSSTVGVLSGYFSSSGVATSASRLSVGTIGTAGKPVYFKDGVPVACTEVAYYDVANESLYFQSFDFI